MQKLDLPIPAAEPRASNDAGTATIDCAQLLQQFLDASIEDNVRVLHLEQEVDFCRIRQRARGVLTEQRSDYKNLTGEMTEYLQQHVGSVAISDNSVRAEIQHRNLTCYINSNWYDTLRGSVLVIHIFHDRNIPESLEQTSLDQSSIMTLRQAPGLAKSGVTLICSDSSDLLCDLYYPLLGEFNQLDQKVVSFESTPRKKVSRINQITQHTLHESTIDTSCVFIDWEKSHDAGLLNHVLSQYQSTVIFVRARHLPAAIRQLTDIAISERQLASNLDTLIEFGRVSLICPHCADAHQPGKFEIGVLSESGFDTDSTLNYAPGCNRCDHTGYNATRTLMSLYKVNDLLRRKIETRSHKEISHSLAADKVISIREQRRLLISTGQVEFSLSATG